MSGSEHTTAQAASVADLRDTCWIRIGASTLDHAAAQVIRQACLRALERSVGHVVIDLTGVDHVSLDGIDVIRAAGEALSVKRSRLWLANTRDDGVLRIPFTTQTLDEFAGLSPALDDALTDAARPPDPAAQSERREP